MPRSQRPNSMSGSAPSASAGINSVMIQVAAPQGSKYLTTGRWSVSSWVALLARSRARISSGMSSMGHLPSKEIELIARVLVEQPDVHRPLRLRGCEERCEQGGEALPQGDGRDAGYK